MAYLHRRTWIQVQTQIRTPNSMATLYYAGHVHIAQTRTQIPTPYFRMEQESESESLSESVYGNVNKPLLLANTEQSRTKHLRTNVCVMNAERVFGSGSWTPQLEVELIGWGWVWFWAAISYGSFTLPETESGTESDWFLSYAEIGSRDPSPGLYNAKFSA